VKKLAAWVDGHPEAIRPFTDYGDRLIAADNKPRQGALPAALACGAHLAVQNEAPWNSIGHVYKDYPADVRLMREGWRITEYDHWRAAVENLLTAPGSTATKAAEDVVAGHLAAMRSDGVWEAEDGAAPPSVRAWDYGRAVNLARWAAATKLCDMDEARETVQRAGRLSAETYRDWREFSAGYLLGRLIHFEDDDRTKYYRSIRRVHRILAEDPASPWRTLSLSDAA
jgi:hypothetical protein